MTQGSPPRSFHGQILPAWLSVASNIVGAACCGSYAEGQVDNEIREEERQARSEMFWQSVETSLAESSVGSLHASILAQSSSSKVFKGRKKSTPMRETTNHMKEWNKGAIASSEKSNIENQLNVDAPPFICLSTKHRYITDASMRRRTRLVADSDDSSWSTTSTEASSEGGSNLSQISTTIASGGRQAAIHSVDRYLGSGKGTKTERRGQSATELMNDSLPSLAYLSQQEGYDV